MDGCRPEVVLALAGLSAVKPTWYRRAGRTNLGGADGCHQTAGGCLPQRSPLQQYSHQRMQGLHCDRCDAISLSL